MAAAKKVDAEILDSKPVTDKVSSIAQETLDKATEHLGTAEESIRETVTNTAESIVDKKESVSLEVSTAANRARKIVVENPLAAAGVAFVAGFLVTSLLSKKS